MTKLKIWNATTSWEEAEAAWDKGAVIAAQKKPLKRLKTLPFMPGITPETARHLKWKSFKYLLFRPRGKILIKYILKHPFKYTFRYLISLFRKKSFIREGDFFLYGIPSVNFFEKLCHNKKAKIVVGFSYCQKPFECPEGRFSKGCLADPNHEVCRQCDIGKIIAASEEKMIPIVIPTVHAIGEMLFELKERFPNKKILFLITACEMTLNMFGNFSHMLGVKGIGVRLDGRICNTMRAFELSEEGIKPGLTVVTDETQRRILDLVKKITMKPQSNVCDRKACCPTEHQTDEDEEQNSIRHCKPLFSPRCKKNKL